MENCVDDPSSLGVLMPSVSEYAAIAPVPPLLPQAPQVSHGDSSTRSIIVAVGVGVGAAGGVGVGVAVGGEAGAALAVLVMDLPPQDVSAIVKTAINRAE